MLKLCCLIALWLALSIHSAFAHPHSFIEINTTFIAHNQQLTGLKMAWVMDELTSADLLYDADNAASDPEVWKKLAAEVMANVLAQHYFTNIYRQDQPIKYTELPTEYHLSREGHKAVLTFVLPLAKPQPLVGDAFEIFTYDPAYFVDMFYHDQHSLHLPAEMVEQCKVILTTPKLNSSLKAYALSLDKNDSPDEDLELGRQFAQRVTLTCQ